MDDITVRRYEREDLEGCRDLWRELTQRHREIYDDPGIGGDDPGHYFDEHLSKVGAGNIWVAMTGPALVGLLGLIRREDEVEVEPLVVSRASRGNGIGERLLKVAFDEAKAQGAAYLSVRPVARNIEAMRFFWDRGFRTLGHVEMFADLSGKEWVSGATLHDIPFDY